MIKSCYRTFCLGKEVAFRVENVDFRLLMLICTLFSLAYVLQVKVEMELEIQQYEKTKAVREEQLERLTQICQEQAVSDLLRLLCFLTYKNNTRRKGNADNLACNNSRH